MTFVQNNTTKKENKTKKALDNEAGAKPASRKARTRKPKLVNDSASKTSTAMTSSVCPVCHVIEHSTVDVLPWIQCYSL